VDTIVQYNPHAAIGAPSAWGNRNATVHSSYEEWPYRGAVWAAHLCRFLSVLMGAGTVLCTYAIARRLFPHPTWLAPAAAALNALIPQYVFISASINNDVPATLLSAICLWLLVCIVQDGASTKRLCALGIVLGLAALTKLNALVLLPMSAVVLLILARKQGGVKALLRWGLLAYGSAAAVGAWWYIRNWVLYRDPFGLDLMFAVLPKRAQRPSLSELLRLLDGALKSFFGVFGWFNIAMEPGVYQLFMVGLLAGTLGLIGLVHGRMRRKEWTELGRLALLAMWATVYVVALVGWTQARYPQGRLLFPAISAIVILWLLGIAQWLRGSWSKRAVLGLVMVLGIFSALVPYRYIAPAYARADRLSAAERQEIPNPITAIWKGKVRLLGYELDDSGVQRGTRLWAALYWEALDTMEDDYSVFAHLVDARGVIIAQCDTYPGSGNDPTSGWTPGEAIRDRYPLDVPTVVLAQAPFRVRVGLYDAATGQRVPAVGSDGTTVESVELPLELGLRQDSVADLGADLKFAGIISLTDYSVEPLVIEAGGSLKIVFRWEALQDVKKDNKVFAQLLRAGDQIWGQSDHVPVRGLAPTRTWKAGQVIVDEFQLSVSPDAPADVYDLVVGLYDSATVDRLELPDRTDTLRLGRIVVRGP
jgi:hypothetical protein